MENFHGAWKEKMRAVYADPTAELLPNNQEVQRVQTPEDQRGRHKIYIIRGQFRDQIGVTAGLAAIDLSRHEIGVKPCNVKARDEEQLLVAATKDKKVEIRRILETLFGDQDIGIGQKGALAMASYDQTGKLDDIRLSGLLSESNDSESRRPPDDEGDKNDNEFLAVMSGDDIRDFVRDVRRGDRVGIPIPPAHFDIFAAAGQPLHIEPFERQDFFTIGRHPSTSKRKQVTAEVTAIDVSLDRLVLQEGSKTDYSSGIHRDVLSELPLELTPAELMRFIRGQIKKMSSVAYISQIAARHF